MNINSTYIHSTQEEADAFWNGPAAKGAYRLPLLGTSWHVFPVHGPVAGKCTCGNPNCKSPAKHPVSKGWQKLATDDLSTIEKWKRENPEYNLGVLTGSEYQLLVLDVDPRNGGLESLQELGITPEVLRGCCEVRTGSDGRHYYMKVPHGVEIPRCSSIGPGLDIKWEGGFVVAPGSRHVSGERYAWVDLDPDLFVKTGEIPQLILDLLNKAKEGKHSSPLVTEFEDGDRNKSLIRVAGKMVHDGHPYESVLAALREVNRITCKPPVEDSEVIGVATSAAKYEPDFDLSGQRIKPVPLPDLVDVMPLDPEILPVSLRDYLVDNAERMGVPLDFVAIPALLTVGSLLGRQVGIRPKARDDFSTFGNNYGFIVAPPGMKKSAAIDVSMKLFEPLNAAARTAYRREMHEFKTRQMFYDNQKKALQKMAREAAHSKSDLERIIAENILEEPGSPVLKRYSTNDTTVEGLIKVLVGNPNGIVIVSDELARFLAMLEATHQNGARSFYNEAWETKLSVDSDRAGRDHMHLEPPCVSILGTIQPGPLADLVAKTVGNPKNNDGFLTRFQLAVYPDIPACCEGVDRKPDRKAAEQAKALIAALSNVGSMGISFEEIENGTPYLRYCSQAQRISDDWRQANGARARAYGDRSPMSAHLRKYPKLFPMISLVIHMLDDQGPCVSVEAAEKAKAWTEYLESHARRIFTPALTDGMLGAKHLLKKIQEGRLGERFSLRDTYINKWAHLTDKRQAEAAMKILVEYGWIFKEPETRGPGGPYFRVNPEALEG